MLKAQEKNKKMTKMILTREQISELEQTALHNPHLRIDYKNISLQEEDQAKQDYELSLRLVQKEMWKYMDPV